tara:strand:- start:4880 stop:6034 length:1155 start_codon:yes stop_codon:yes gene_type:complete
MKKNNYIFKIMLIAIPLLFISCDNDDDDTTNLVTAPDTYEFLRDGVSTVSFTGQTARLNMADEIYSALNANSKSKAQILEMFNDGKGFTGSGLDDSGKKVGSKTASGCLHGVMATTKSRFTTMIEDYADNVIPAWSATAANGKAGLLTDTKRSIHVNANGWEIDQTFIKGIIGAMCVDQIVNNYLDPCQLDSGSRKDDNTNGVLSGDKNYTDMEHKWDEAFGYLYGQEDNAKRADLGSSPTGNGTTLNKYFKKINDSNEPGLAQTVFDAFKLGRAAIVAGNYDLRDQQAAIIQIHLSKVIGYKAVDYIDSYLAKKDATPADAIHALSEGYGFILSLVFTNDGTGKPYFSQTEVDGMLSKMTNFWSIKDADLTSIKNDIKSKFNI